MFGWDNKTFGCYPVKNILCHLNKILILTTKYTLSKKKFIGTTKQFIGTKITVGWKESKCFVVPRQEFLSVVGTTKRDGFPDNQKY